MNNKESYFERVCIIILLFVVILTNIIFLLLLFSNIDDFTNLAALGNFLSGLFAGCAFWGVLWTLYKQGQQTRKQQENFDKQLNIAQEQFDQQTKENQIKSFEDTFF